MTRPTRVFVEGGFYHVYTRLGRGERVFAAEHEAAEFTRILKEVAERDDVTVLAWVPAFKPLPSGGSQR